MQTCPYIGVTGFTDRQQVIEAFFHVPDNAHRRLMVGVLASYKSLRRLPMREQWAKQTPPSDELHSIFFEHPQVLNLIHYSADIFVDKELCDDLLALAHHAGSVLHGFQLNIVWPSSIALRDFHRFVRKQKLSVVLQINHGSIALAGGTPVAIVEKLRRYEGLIQHLLVDASGGLGKALNVSWAQLYLRAFRDAQLPFALGVAGGFGPNSMEPIKELLAEFPDLSWDAQGRLRDKDHRLNPILAGEYLDLSYALAR
ncbi:MAG: hypothetical protein Q7S95_04140 [bacterium]|nr:hypothetical protein [bacterium]